MSLYENEKKGPCDKEKAFDKGNEISKTPSILISFSSWCQKRQQKFIPHLNLQCKFK